MRLGWSHWRGMLGTTNAPMHQCWAPPMALWVVGTVFTAAMFLSNWVEAYLGHIWGKEIIPVDLTLPYRVAILLLVQCLMFLKTLPWLVCRLALAGWSGNQGQEGEEQQIYCICICYGSITFIPLTVYQDEFVFYGCRYNCSEVNVNQDDKCCGNSLGR